MSFDSVYRNRFSGAKRQKVKSKTSFYYIPLYDTLNNLLQHDFQRELSITNADNDLIQDFCDGSASSLKSIYLVAVAKSQDITRYGIDIFLHPFIEDLKHLYIDGIALKIGSVSKTYHGALLAFLADTLAAHQVGGFKGSMSFAYRICRTCMITKEAAQTCFSEDDSVN